MPFNFTDDPSPDLTTYIDAAGDVQLTDGGVQGDYITSSFGGSTVTISVLPPSGWNMDWVEWDPGNGTYGIPDPGLQDTYNFEYQVSQGTNQKSGTGIFKIKKAGT